MSLLGAPMFIATVIATVAAGGAAMLAPLVRDRAARRHLLWHGALVVALTAAIAAVVPLHPRIVLPVLREHVTPANIALPSPAGAGMRALAAYDGGRVVLVLWLFGFAYIALRYALSVACASELRRGAGRVDAERWGRHIAAARATLGYDGPLELLVSREIDVPIVTGFWKPALLLPIAASEWSDRDAHLVCLHEIAHLERGDHIGRAIGALAVALHWFNPVVWWLDARASADSELAADEAVLQAGVRATDYADMLISIAERTVWLPTAVPGVALMRRPLLAARVHAILAAPQRGTALSRRRRRLAIIAAACIAAATGSTRVRLAAAHEASVPPANHLAARADRQDEREAPSVPRSRTVRERVERTARPSAQRSTAPREPDEAWKTRAIAGLTDLLDDPSPQVRAAATHSLERLASSRQ